MISVIILHTQLHVRIVYPFLNITVDVFVTYE